MNAATNEVIVMVDVAKRYPDAAPEIFIVSNNLGEELANTLKIATYDR